MRTRLIESLLRCRAPLVVFSAPTGSGKTLTVRQWLDADERPFAWLQLDGGDNDPVTLLQYVARALGHVTPLDPVVRSWLELPQPPVGEVVVPTLVAAVSSAPSFVLVLDDSHLVREPRCWTLVSSLVDALPPGSVIVVCGRHDPPLPLGRLRAQGALAEYRNGQLAFDRDETRQLLAVHGVTADDAIEALVTATEGWAAGIYLAVLASRGSGASPGDLAITGDRREIADYLTTEVLADLDPDTVRFLTRTSIVWRLCGELCDVLTGGEDGAATLHEIDRDNLFLMRVEGAAGWYRYHHLFADLLQAELRRREARLVPDLHRHAARWFEDRDLVLDAVHHWLAAGDDRAAGDLVVSRWVSRYLSGRILTARQWVEAFTPDQIRSHAPLTIAAAWVKALTGDCAAARGLLATLAGRDGDATSSAGAASVGFPAALLRSVLADRGAEQMREDARSALRLGEACGADPWHGLAEHMLGVAEMLCDCDTAAEKAFRRARVENGAMRNGFELASLGHLSLIAGDHGRWSDAAGYAAEAARVAASDQLVDYLPSMPARMARDRICARAGDDDAVADLEDLVVELDDDFFPWLRVQTALLLAEAAIDRGDERAARGWLTEALGGLNRWDLAPGLERRLAEVETRLRVRSAIEPITLAEGRVLQLLPTNLTMAEIAVRLSVSRNTVGTHVKSLYRKLGVTRRSRAVERAAALGLLQEPLPAG